MAHRPTSFYDTSTGWRVFPETEGAVAVFDNIHLKWEANKDSWANTQHIIYLSIDSGQTWHKGERFSVVFENAFPGKSFYFLNDRDEILAPILNAREAWKRQRVKERKQVLDSASPEEKEARLKKFAEVKEQKRIREEKLANERTVIAMDHMIKLGPELIKLKEKVEHVVGLMSKGGIDRPIVQHASKLWEIKRANYLLSQYEKYFMECHKRTGK